MKKTYLLMVALIVGAILAPAFKAKAQDANRMFYTQLVQPSTNSAAGRAVDISAFKGNAAFVISIGPGEATFTNTVTLAHSATSGGTYATITNISGTVGTVVSVVGTNEYTMVTYPIDLNRIGKFVKATVDKNAPGLDTAPVSVILVAPFKSQ